MKPKIVGKQNNKPKSMIDTKNELLKSFHEQFAENQNHHQTVFTQFISAVFVVVVGYAIVYTNISSKADFFNVIRDGDLKIISYSIIHLIGSFFVAELILTLLCALVLNIGYGFRRDQNVNYKIRMRFMKKKEYEYIFGEKSFNPTNKKLMSYLPGYNLIFVSFILLLHILLVFSLFYALVNFDNFTFSIYNHWFAHGLLSLLIILPFGISICLFRQYYIKYKKAVNG